MLKEVLCWLIISIMISQLSQIVLHIYLRKIPRLVFSVDALLFDGVIVLVGFFLMIIRGIILFYIFDLLVVGAFLVILRIDNYSMIIPDGLNIFILVLAISKMVMSHTFDWLNIAMSVIILAFGVLLNLCYRKMRGVEAMGYGDLKLIFVYSLYMSMLHASVALMIACISAILVEIIVRKKQRKMFPFGPYLVFGMAIALFLKFI